MSETHTKIPEPPPFEPSPAHAGYISLVIDTVEHMKGRASKAAEEISSYPYPTDSPLSSAVYSLRNGNLDLALDQLKVAHYEALKKENEDPS